MDIERWVSPIHKAHSFQDFLNSLVGKRLKELLDGSSFANLYVGNKYGIGPAHDEDDPQVQLSRVLNFASGYINFRKLDPLRAKLDAADAEDMKRPEVQAYKKQYHQILKQEWEARKAGDTEKAKELSDLKSNLPNPGSYRKNMDDMQVLVKQFHNSPLTQQDVTPSDSDSKTDKERYAAGEEAFNKLKELLGR
jgi:hypothetical protein